MRRGKQLRIGFRVASVILLLLLFLFNLRADRREPRLIKIDEISPALDFARVRVVGVLQQAPRKMGGGEVCYLLDDGTGTLAVFAEDTWLPERPRSGCSMQASGRLSVGQGNQVRLRVTHSSGIEILDEALPLELRGRVNSVELPEPDSHAPCRIGLETAAGQREVVFWFKFPQSIEIGDDVTAVGTAGAYRGRLQVVVRRLEDLRVQSEQ